MLSSGKRSRFYVDKYRFSTEPDLLSELARCLAAKLPDGVQRLAGVELGAVPLVVAVAIVTRLPYVIVRKKTKEHGTARSIEGRLEAGERLALIEDVVTTGTQAIAAARGLQEAGARVVKVVAVLDRREAGAEATATSLEEFPFEAVLKMADVRGAGRD